MKNILSPKPEGFLYTHVENLLLLLTMETSRKVNLLSASFSIVNLILEWLTVQIIIKERSNLARIFKEKK